MCVLVGKISTEEGGMSRKVGNENKERKQQRSDDARSRKTAAEAERWETKQRDADWMTSSSVGDYYY